MLKNNNRTTVGFDWLSGKKIRQTKVKICVQLHSANFIFRRVNRILEKRVDASSFYTNRKLIQTLTGYCDCRNI